MCYLVVLLNLCFVVVDVIQRDVMADGEGGDEAIIVGVESSEDVRNDLILTQGMADGGQRVRQCLHLAKVVGHRCSFLLGSRELSTDLDDPCMRPGGEHTFPG